MSTDIYELDFQLKLAKLSLDNGEIGEVKDQHGETIFVQADGNHYIEVDPNGEPVIDVNGKQQIHVPATESLAVLDDVKAGLAGSKNLDFSDIAVEAIAEGQGKSGNSRFA